jgi:hypothetical protein
MDDFAVHLSVMEFEGRGGYSDGSLEGGVSQAMT